MRDFSDRRPPAVLLLLGVLAAAALHVPKAIHAQGSASQPAPTGKPWIDMDYGPFLTATVDAPRPRTGPRTGNFAYKGLVIPLAADRSMNVVFDTDLLRPAAGWTGGFLDWKNIAFDGSHGTHMSIAGTQLFGNRVVPGWRDPRPGGSFADPRARQSGSPAYGPLPREWARWRGLYLHGRRTILSYTVGTAGVTEAWETVEGSGLAAFRRVLELDRTDSELSAVLCEEPLFDHPRAAVRILSRERLEPAGEGPASERIAVLPAGPGRILAVAASDRADGARAAVARFDVSEPGCLRLAIPGGLTAARLEVFLWQGAESEMPRFRDVVSAAKPAEELSSLTRGGPARWGSEIIGRGARGADRESFTADDLAAPLENPYRSWMRLSGLDFFADGKRLAVSTWMGDVWLVDGIDEPLERLRWRRYATGLFQPLGLKIRDETIYVLGRDQITRLHDLNGDGEADFYECFNNDHQVTDHFHEFAMDLQDGPDGSFYYMKGGCHALDASVPQHGTLLQVSGDGSRTDIVAAGFRAPNGLAIGPRAEMLTTDQEGHWTPMNRIDWLEPGGFYGYRFTLPEHMAPAGRPFRWRAAHERPLSYERPLCWIHKTVDRSPAAPVWVPPGRLGPLGGGMLLLSYGTGRVFSVLYETVEGQVQGGIVRVPGIELPTGVMRGRFHPTDGHLYACGLFGWSSDRTLPGGLYRLRYTGKPAAMPVELHATRAGLLIGFSSPLAPESAQDAAGYSLSAWNYHWREQYGSEDYKLSSWTPGRDRLDVASARLSRDGRMVFLEIAGMQLCMQMQVRYNLRGAAGERARGEIQSTVNILGDTSGWSDRFEGGLPAPRPAAADAPRPASSSTAHVVFACGGADPARREALRKLADGYKTTTGRSVAVCEADAANGAGLEALAAADVLVLDVDTLALPAAALEQIRIYLESKKPLVLLRAAVRALHEGERAAGGAKRAAEGVLGLSSCFEYPSTRLQVVRMPEAAGHAVLAGLPSDLRSSAPLVYAHPLPPSARALLEAHSLDPTPPDSERPLPSPAAWLDTARGRRLFVTTLGTPGDLESDAVRRLIENAIEWALGRSSD